MVVPPPTSLQERIVVLVKSLQFVWFTGHLLTIFGATHYFVSVIFYNSNPILYRLAYVGSVLSYSVVIYKSIGIPQLNIQYAQKLAIDENSHYFILAVFWLFSNPITVTLIPYFTFSVFHALDYVRTNVIPIVFPCPATAGDVPTTWQAKVQRNIKSMYDRNYGPVMQYVAQAEVTVIVVRLLLDVLRLRIVPFLVYTQFLRFRYHLSVYTRKAFSELRVKLDGLLLSPQTDSRTIPAFVPKAYVTIKNFLSQFGEQQQTEPTHE